jgi:hypothetical protein
MTRVIKAMQLLVSPAALCLWLLTACVAVSVAGANASRHIMIRQDSAAGFASAAIPIEMKRWDEPLFNRVSARVKTEMAEFLKGIEQNPETKPGEPDQGWRPARQDIRYIEQFRTFTHVSFLEAVTTTVHGQTPQLTLRAVNFNKETNAEFTLADILEGAYDRSKALEAMADYARADLKDQLGEEEETDALTEMTKADFDIYNNFTLCPSTRFEKAAGLTVHFSSDSKGPYAGTLLRVTIPPTVFSRFLKPGMRSLFGGEPRQAPVVLDDAG